MYTALMDSKIIGDPYYRKNDLQYRWVGLEDWSYSRTFAGTFGAELFYGRLEF